MTHRLVFVAAALACTAQGVSFADASNKPDLRSHLIGGSRVSPSGREYAVMLRLQKDYRVYEFCNGVRLNENWIVTAAQCMNPKKYSHVRFTFAKNGAFVHKYVNARDLDFVYHPGYDRKSTKDNIALVQINLGEWTDPNQYLTLPSRGRALDMLIDVEAEVTGFEHTYDSNYGDEELVSINSITVKIVMYTHCKGKYLQNSYINEQICSSSVFSGQTRGLSEEGYGTPIVLKNRTFLGIAQQVSPSPLGLDEPMIFHRMDPYVNWINRITGIPL